MCLLLNLLTSNLHEESKPGKISRGIVVGTELEIPGIKQKFADDL